MWLANLSWSYYPKLEFSRRKDGFNDMTWKLELPLLSRAQISWKTKQCFWSHLKTWTAHKQTHTALSSRGKMFTKIKQFCECDLLISAAPVIRS